tara:strand:+ start:222 stop:1229 length:1008 start_codon:yes stop_codon:yes gene_type:complete
MARHGPSKVEYPTRPPDAVPYSSIFRGRTPADKARIGTISGLVAYLPLYNALKSNRAQADNINERCFTWVCNQITYTSSNCTFDRNMWIANYIGSHWNNICAGESKADQNERHVAPILQSINFLLGGGLDEDTSRPPAHLENMLPELLRHNNLSSLRKAAQAVAWKNMALSIENADDDPIKHYAKSRYLMMSAELASAAGPYLKSGFSKSRQLEAGAALAERWRAQYEATPQEDFSIKSHKYYAAVGSELGMYLLHSAEVSKTDMARGAALCKGDLREVHNADELKLQRALKLVSLKTLFASEAQTPENESPPKTPSWMQTSDACCYKGSPINLH